MLLSHPKLLLKLATPIVATALLAHACGEKAPGPAAGGPAPGPVEKIFIDEARTNQIPVRLLLAAAFVESDLVPDAATTHYAGRKNLVGIAAAETAFGLSYKQLGLEDDPNRHTLKAQIPAYARLVRQHLDEAGLSYNPNPTNAEQKFVWVQEIAKLHRASRDGLKTNIRVVFINEIIELLNLGYKWQDPASGEVISFPKENPPISPANLPVHLRDSLELYTEPGEIASVERLELTYDVPPNRNNAPNHVLVIHCPFRLSACLEMQNHEAPVPHGGIQSARLQAHYIIPAQPDSLIDKPLQVAQHSQALLVSGKSGRGEVEPNAIIVMLVGPSGRYVASARRYSRPDWFDPWQLRHMGSVIQRICALLEAQNSVDRKECIDPHHPSGVKFRTQGASESYQWGDVPDFDENIFYPYVATPEGLRGRIKMELSSPTNVFPAGTPIPIRLKHIKETTKIAVELAESCGSETDRRLIWTTEEIVRSRNAIESLATIKLFSAGPNGNGEHFLKIAAFNKRGDLLGWEIASIFVTGYEKDDQASQGTIRDCSHL